MAKTYTVFISHRWDYVRDLMGLRNLLISRGYFKVHFVEIPPHDPINSDNSCYIRRVLKSHIQSSDVVIGMCGMYAAYSEWMDWELETAKSLGKPIIGVIPRGQERLPTTVTTKADRLVRWNTESIVQAIRELA